MIIETFTHLLNVDAQREGTKVGGDRLAPRPVATENTFLADYYPEAEPRIHVLENGIAFQYSAVLKTTAEPFVLAAGVMADVLTVEGQHLMRGSIKHVADSGKFRTVWI